MRKWPALTSITGTEYQIVGITSENTQPKFMKSVYPKPKQRCVDCGNDTINNHRCGACQDWCTY